MSGQSMSFIRNQSTKGISPSHSILRGTFRRAVTGALILLSVAANCQPVVSADSDYLKIRLVRAKEIQSATFWSASGTAQAPFLTSQTAHVVAYTYRHMIGNDLNGDASNGTGGGGGGGINPEAPQSLVEEEGGIGDPGGGGPGGGGPGGGGSGSTIENYWISIPGTNSNGDLQGFIADPSLTFQAYTYISLQNIPNNMLLALSTWWSSTSSIKSAGVRVKLLPGQEVTVCYAKPALPILPSGVGQVMVTKATLITTPAVPPQTGSTSVMSVGQQEVWYSLNRKSGIEDTAVDSRKGYGQPNREGQFPADPNAELRNINFGDWIFKGGMFVGNMPQSTGDRSGTARFQLWEPTIETQVPRMTIFTVYQYGKPSHVNGAMTIGLYGPLPGPDVYIGEAGTTWANKWDITPRAAIPSGGSFEQNKDPYKKFVLDGLMGAGLISTNITKVYDKMHPSPGNPTLMFPKTTWETINYPGLCLALHDEQTLVDQGWSGWRYFVDKEFQPLVQDVIPTAFRDLAPRLWRFYVTDSKEAGDSASWLPGAWVP